MKLRKERKGQHMEFSMIRVQASLQTAKVHIQTCSQTGKYTAISTKNDICCKVTILAMTNELATT